MTVKLKKCPKGELAKAMPWPAKNSNKYTRGKLVVIGGAPSYPGAVCLASEAAYKMGAGYVEVACSQEALPAVHAYNPNVVAKSWDGWSAASTGLGEVQVGHPCACLVGSGFDASESSSVVSDMQRHLLFEALHNVAHPVVVDGGALSYLASDEGRMATRERSEAARPTVVTPHFGEGMRLGAPLGMKFPSKPEKNPEEVARFAQQLADAYAAVVVLKGPRTFIAYAQVPRKGKAETVYLMEKGTSALAKAGTGDVLAGMVSSLVAQGISPLAAANLAANVHAEAGRCAGAKIGEISVCATDVAASIPEALGKFC